MTKRLVEIDDQLLARALGRAHQDKIGTRLEELARNGQMWTCRLIDLEVVYGSRARDVADVIE